MPTSKNQSSSEHRSTSNALSLLALPISHSTLTLPAWLQNKDPAPESRHNLKHPQHTSVAGLRLPGSTSDVTVVLGGLEEKSHVFTGCTYSIGFERSMLLGLSSKVTS